MTSSNQMILREMARIKHKLQRLERKRKKKLLMDDSDDGGEVDPSTAGTSGAASANVSMTVGHMAMHAINEDEEEEGSFPNNKEKEKESESEERSQQQQQQQDGVVETAQSEPPDLKQSENDKMEQPQPQPGVPLTQKWEMVLGAAASIHLNDRNESEWGEGRTCPAAAASPNTVARKLGFEDVPPEYAFGLPRDHVLRRFPINMVLRK
eukprot:jgi/Chlat1/3658/Chrsp238S03643